MGENKDYKNKNCQSIDILNDKILPINQSIDELGNST
jgi:hypothetical protein